MHFPLPLNPVAYSWIIYKRLRFFRVNLAFEKTDTKGWLREAQISCAVTLYYLSVTLTFMWVQYISLMMFLRMDNWKRKIMLLDWGALMSHQDWICSFAHLRCVEEKNEEDIFFSRLLSLWFETVFGWQKMKMYLYQIQI